MAIARGQIGSASINKELAKGPVMPVYTAAQLTGAMAASKNAGRAVRYSAGANAPIRMAVSDGVSWKVMGSKPIGVTFASIGDSNVDQNSRWILPPQASPSSAWFSDGFVAKFRSLSLQRINFPLANELGVSGYKIGDVLANLVPQLGLMAEYPQFCLIWMGSNNLTAADGAGGSYAEMVAGLEATIKAVQDLDITPVLYPIPPRGGAVLTTAQLLKQNNYNNYMRARAAKSSNVICIDYMKKVIDITSTTGVPLATMFKADNLHMANAGAYEIGLATLEGMSPFLPPAPLSFCSAVDYYDAVNNPTGSLLRSGTTNYSLMAGTTGTHTASSGFTTSGNLATGFTSVKSGGTATCAVTASKVARDDGWASGEAQQIVIAVTGAGGADEIHNLRATPAIADVAAGEWFYAECKLQITAAPVNINAIELYLLETATPANQTAIDGGYNSALSLMLPSKTWTEVLRTPPIQRQAGATALQVNLRTRMNTVSGTAGVTYKVMDYAVRKVNSALV